MTWQFSAQQVEPSLGFETWPEGWFPVVITKAEEKPNTGDDAGFTWHLSIKGLDGPVRDKTQVIQIPYKSGNQMRMDIAQKTMSAICHVTNVLTFQHPGQLANIPFYVKSGVRKAKEGDKVYQDWPDFKNQAGETALDIYKRLNGQGGGAPQQPQQSFGTQPQQQFGGQPAQPQQQPQQFQQPQQPGPGAAWPAQPGQAAPQQPQPQPQPMQGGQPQGGTAWPAQPQQAQPQQPGGFQQQPMQGGAPQAGPAPWGPQG